MSDALDDGLLLAEQQLASGMSLTARERFATALDPLRDAVARFEALHLSRCMVRAQTELALCYIYLGQFASAQTILASAQATLAEQPDPLAQAHYHQAEGYLALEQGAYTTAVEHLRQAGSAFAAHDQLDDAARAWCHLGMALRFSQPHAAMDWIAQARAVAVSGDPRLHEARCDYFQGVLEIDLNRYAEASARLEGARAVGERQDQPFLVASCDLSRGVALYALNQYSASLRAYRQAQAGFADLGMSGAASLCESNMAVVLYAMHRYTEALTFHTRVADQALAEGRLTRVARCQTNMALCYERLGRYDQALSLHQRAYATFLAQASLTHAALCQENLAGVCALLGRHTQAEAHYLAARDLFVRQALPIYVARCDTHLAELYLLQRQYPMAQAYLVQARAACAAADLPLHMAACDRELARVLTAQGEVPAAREHLAEARAIFAEHGLLVDVALCDVAVGEANLVDGHIERAEAAFGAALPWLDPALPDEGWRAYQGLGRCAQARGAVDQALTYGLTAIALTQRVRAPLPPERLRGGFCADRRPLYESTLELALAHGADTTALAVVEASKPPTFHGTMTQPLQYDLAGQAEVQAWLEHETRLRAEMSTLRHAVRVAMDHNRQMELRGADAEEAAQADTVARLKVLGEAYEATLERLRLVSPHRPGVAAMSPFSVDAFRQAAKARLPSGWACLAYYLLNDDVVVFYLDAAQLKVDKLTLNQLDRVALRQCCDTSSETREVLYAGRLRGAPVSTAAGTASLRRLHRLLIPPSLSTGASPSVLMIAPHGLLHALPFQALEGPDGPLGARIPLMYTPSLTILQALLEEPVSTVVATEPSKGLVVGVSEFGAAARPLPRVATEVAVVRAALGPGVEVLEGVAATRETLMALNASGALAEYNVLHFATHAVLDPIAPSQSRVLLADDSLTYADILTLRLRARLVVLSACESALGERQPGDEMVGLARAFLWAGAATVVASLWPVADEVAEAFVGQLYHFLNAGRGLAQAVQAAQLDLAARGAPIYDWAAFVAIGCP